MAILFYEGLPGAGKSYEAMATQVIPMLQKGREVVAYIEGLNHERIAEAAQLPVDTVRELLHVLTRDDMRPREGGKDGPWIEKTRDNAFHVFDEAQNWWSNRTKATEALTQFVTEHRHRGIDVLLMGQSLKDVLALWRRRVDQKFTFLKLTALGSDKRYRVTVFKGQGDDQFVKVTDKVNKYDSKYFGTYASHVAGDTNTETYTDKRANVFSTWPFRYGFAIVAMLAVWGAFKAWAFFHPELPKKLAQEQSAQAAGGPVAGSARSAVPSPASDKRSPQERYFSELTAKGRIRLSGLLEFKGRVSGVVEWLDGNTRVIERMTLDTMRDLGVAVVVTDRTVRLSLGQWIQLATMWPVEAEGRVSDYRQETIRPVADSGAPPSANAGGAASLPGSGLTIIDQPHQPAAELTRQPTRTALGRGA